MRNQDEITRKRIHVLLNELNTLLASDDAPSSNNGRPKKRAVMASAPYSQYRRGSRPKHVRSRGRR